MKKQLITQAFLMFSLKHKQGGGKSLKNSSNGVVFKQC
jgi:hypothetical protein